MSSDKTLIHIITSNRWGGIERYALDICRHFRDVGWEVAAITRDARAVDNLFEKEEIKLLHAPLGSMIDLQSVIFLIKIFKASPHRRTIIHAHGFRSAFIALLARKISRRHDIRIIATRHKVKKGRDTALFRRIYRHIDAMVFVSQMAKDRFLSTWHNRELPFPKEKMFVVRNSLNIPEMEIHPREGKGPVIAMFHGPLKPGKGLETIIDALPMLKGKKIRLRIVGSGRPDYVDRLRRRAMTRGVMEMIDWHKHCDVPLNLIRDADFGVLPSITEEAFGLANIEYMACGKPQVASSNGAQPEYITDGREGFLIPPGNPVLLADAISKLASDPLLRERMGERALQSFKANRGWENFISLLSDIYLPS